MGAAAGLLEQGIARETEDPLPDLVALDLRRPAGDRHRPVPQDETTGDRPGAVEERRVATDQRGRDRRRLVPLLGEHQLRDVALRTGAAALHRADDRAHVEHLHGVVDGEVRAHAGSAPAEALGVGVEQLDQRGVGQRGSAAGAATDADALVAERGPGDGPPVVHRPDDVVVGDEDVVEEDLVELRTTCRHLQRPDLDARGVHVDDHRRDALVLGHVRVGADRRQPERGHVGPARPHLLPVDQPATVDAGALRGDPGRVGPGVGLAEQLAPDDLAGQRRPDPAGDLLGGPVLDHGEDHPARDAELRALDAGGGELLLDDELLDRLGVSTVGRRPVRHGVAAVDQRGRAWRRPRGLPTR